MIKKSSLKKVLIVEDDKASALMLSKLVESCGYLKAVFRANAQD